MVSQSGGIFASKNNQDDDNNNNNNRKGHLRVRIIKDDHCKEKIFAQAPEEHSEGSLCWEEQQEVSRRDRGAFLLDPILMICLSAF